MINPCPRSIPIHARSLQDIRGCPSSAQYNRNAPDVRSRDAATPSAWSNPDTSEQGRHTNSGSTGQDSHSQGDKGGTSERDSAGRLPVYQQQPYHHHQHQTQNQSHHRSNSLLELPATANLLTPQQTSMDAARHDEAMQVCCLCVCAVCLCVCAVCVCLCVCVTAR
jgi:hypothetical protein